MKILIVRTKGLPRFKMSFIVFTKTVTSFFCVLFKLFYEEKGPKTKILWKYKLLISKPKGSAIHRQFPK